MTITMLLEQSAVAAPSLLVLFSTLILVLPLFLPIAYQVFFSPLSDVPGPFWASVAPFWRIRRIILGNWHSDIVHLHEKHGNVVRIAPNEVSINTPDAIQIIYGHTGKPWVKDAWYEAWWVKRSTHPFFAETDPAKHRDLRRRVAKAFTMSYVIEMERHVDATIQQFMDNMNLFVGKKIDLAEWTQFFAFDVVGELAFGKNFGLLDAGRDHEGLIEWVYFLLTSQAALGWFWKDGDPSQYSLFRYMLNKGYLKTTGKVLDCWPRPEVEKRVRNKINIRTTSDRNDLFAHFLQMKNPDGTPVPPKDVFGESMNVVAAGADTTAISLRAIIRYVASNPRVYRKLQQEIDEANSAGLLAQVVRFEQVQGLTYFNAVVKEALRLHPAVGYQLPRVVPASGMQIEGYFIPGGSTVGVNAWSLHRNKEIYGDDADQFIPERWLIKDCPDKLKRMDQCYATFGFGSRTCIGKNMAQMELSKLLLTFFRDFEVEISNPEKPWTLVCAWFVYSANFNVTLYRRQQGGTGTMAPKEINIDS